MRRGVVQGVLAAGLIVSVILNLFLWSGRQDELRTVPAVEAQKEVQGKQLRKTGHAPLPQQALPVKKKPVLLKEVAYDQGAEAVRVEFSGYDDSPTSAEELKKHLSCEPSLPLKVHPHEWRASAYLLYGDFVCGREYLFKIRKGLRNGDQGELKRDLQFSLRIPDKSPRGRVLTGGLYFPWQSGQWILPLELMNVEKLEVRISRFHDSNLNPFGLDDDWRTGDYRERLLTRDVRLSYPKNKRRVHPLDLRQFVPDCRPGAYFVEFFRRDRNQGTRSLDSRIFFVTDLGIAAAKNDSQKRIEFFVRRLSDGRGAAGASVSLYSYQKQRLGTVRADQDGHGFFDREVFQTGGGDRPKMLMAVSGKDVNILELDGEQHDLSEFGNAGKYFVLNGARTFLYTERDIYRNDEKVYYRGLVRMYQEGISQILKNAPMTLTLRDPQDTVLWERRVNTNVFGALEGEFQLPSGAMAGYYTLNCGIPGSKDDSVRGLCQFRVGDFVPDRLKVKIQAEKPLLHAGESMDWQTSAKYYFGPAAENCSADFRVQVSQAEFPAHWKGYAVGNAAAFRPAVLHKENKRDYRDGDRFQFSCRENYNQPVLLTGVLSVAEPGGNSVSDSGTAVLLGTDDYLGLKYHPVENDRRNAAVQCRWLFYDDQAKVENAEKRRIFFKLSFLKWNYVLKKSGNQFRREWIQEKIAMAAPEPLMLGAGEETLLLKNLAAGYYELEAGDDSHFTVLNFWHDAGEGGVRSSNPNVLVLETDRREYRPGETAMVTLESPEPGQVMVFCGEIGLEDARCLAVGAGRSSIPIAIPDTFETDRYFCGVTLVSGRDGRRRLFSLLRLKINQDAHRLQVVLDAPEKARPGQRLSVKVSLKDQSGQPAGGFVQLFAVDEGILSLTDYQVPDPFAFFYRDFYCETEFFDTYGKFYPEISLKGSGRIGGDRGRLRKARRKGGLDFRHRKSAVVVLKGQAVPSGGAVEFSVQLPEHSGAMRLMAVAMGEQCVGSQERQLILHHPMTVLGSVPSKMAPGDEFEMTLQAFNHEFPKGEFQLEAELPAGLAALDPLRKIVTLAPGGSGVMVIRCRAEKAVGNQTVRISLRHGENVVRDELFIQIRNLAVPETRTVLKILQPGESAAFAGAEKMAGEQGIASLQIMASPLTGVREALDWLNEYPYGCTEQITAGAFPLLAAAPLRQAGLISPQEELNARDRIFLVCNELMGRRLATGGFAAWPGSSSDWPEAGVYAAHFLFLAERGGYFKLGQCSRDAILSDLRCLSRNLDGGNGLFRAYALYVLAVGGEQCQDQARNILQQEEENLAGLFAAGALCECGAAREAAEVLKGILDRKVWLEDRRLCNFAGPASRLGMLMSIVSEILPEDDRLLEMVRLMQTYYQGRGRGWGTTHDNAWACYGLMQVPQLRQKQTVLPQAALEFSDGSSLTYGQSGVMVLKDRFPVTVRNTGTVPVYLQHSETGILNRHPEHIRNRGLKIRRVYLDDQGREVSRVNHGELVTVRITLESVKDLSDLALVDILPGGLSVEDDRLASRALAVPRTVASQYEGLTPRYLEKGEDRLLLFGALAGGRKVDFSYRLRATTRGKFRIPPCQGEDMYDTGILGQDAGQGVFEVR